MGMMLYPSKCIKTLHDDQHGESLDKGLSIKK